MRFIRDRLLDLLSRWTLRLVERRRYPIDLFADFGAGAAVAPDVYIDRPGNVHLGDRALINRGCQIYCNSGQFKIGNNSHLAGDVYVNAARGTIAIGNGVAIGPKVVLVSHSNDVEGLRPIIETHQTADISIADDVFIGAAAIILPGVRIGPHAVVGAGCVVNRDVEAYAIVAGVPARVIGSRNGAERIR